MKSVLRLVVCGPLLGAIFAYAQPATAEDALTDCRNYRIAGCLIAAEQGHVHAQCSLGLLYFGGIGIPQDHAEAAAWFRRAAEQGDAYARFNLGRMYAEGKGVPQDYVLAHMWLNLSGAGGHERARNARNLLETEMSREQTEEAQRLAREWKQSEP